MDISIIIPTYKRHAVLERTLKSIEHCLPQSSEVIIVDQSRESKEKSSYFCRQYPFVKYLSFPYPSLPKARNKGIVTSKGNIILFIDDDMTVHPDCFAEHIFMHSQENANIIAGRIKQMNGASWADSPKVASINNDTAETTGNFDLDYEGDVLYATGGHVSIKREVFRNCGLFNPYFTGNALYEDVEFSLRTRKKGYIIRYDRKAIVYHHQIDRGGCHDSVQSQYLIERLHNQTLFYLLHIKPIPAKSFIMYLKNLTEYISRTKHKSHSILKILLCVMSFFKAYIDASISFLIIPRLRQ